MIVWQSEYGRRGLYTDFNLLYCNFIVASSFRQVAIHSEESICCEEAITNGLNHMLTSTNQRALQEVIYPEEHPTMLFVTNHFSFSFFASISVNFTFKGWTGRGDMLVVFIWTIWCFDWVPVPLRPLDLQVTLGLFLSPCDLRGLLSVVQDRERWAREAMI